MGCMAQRVEEEIFARAGQVDIVCGTRQLQRLPELVEDLRARRAAGAGADRAARVLAVDMDAEVAVDRSDEVYAGGRAGYLTVMRGCDLNCTYCIVPAVRGRVASRPIEDLVREARWMVEQGAQVVTLLGQTVNSYGEDFAKPGPGEPRGAGRQGRPSLADLLRRLQRLDGLERIRLITLHPAYLTDALASALADCDKADRFLPLPAQSGSDRILRAMKRGYTTDLYRRRMDALRERVPDVELSSDWIVGFPGESDADFALSEALLAEQGFVVNYVFKYDPRPTTHAAEELADDVPDEVKKARNQRLLALSERVALARLQRHVGTTAHVYVEDSAPRRAGRVVGRSTHGLPVTLDGGPELVGRTVAVAVEDATAFGLYGRLAPTA
jgi:tRNA-2-methylthio-N6-dimethylallyladenosine synthase